MRALVLTSGAAAAAAWANTCPRGRAEVAASRSPRRVRAGVPAGRRRRARRTSRCGKAQQAAALPLRAGDHRATRWEGVGLQHVGDLDQYQYCGVVDHRVEVLDQGPQASDVAGRRGLSTFALIQAQRIRAPDHRDDLAVPAKAAPAGSTRSRVPAGEQAAGLEDEESERGAVAGARAASVSTEIAELSPALLGRRQPGPGSARPSSLSQLSPIDQRRFSATTSQPPLGGRHDSCVEAAPPQSRSHVRAQVG